MISDGTYALLAGGVGAWLQGHSGFPGTQRCFSGGVYIALGLATALSRRH